MWASGPLVNSKRDGEGGVAIRRGIVGDGARDCAALDVKCEGLFRVLRQAGEASLAVAVRADFEFGLAHIHEAVFEDDVDLRVVDRLAGAVLYREIGATGADAAVHLWNFRGLGRQCGAADCEKNDCTQDSQGSGSKYVHFAGSSFTKTIRRSADGCNSDLNSSTARGDQNPTREITGKRKADPSRMPVASAQDDGLNGAGAR